MSVDYMTYLNSDGWDERRRFMYRLVDRRCERCRKKGVELHAHHVSYENLGAERKNEICVLCVGCHHIVHNDRLEAEVAKVTAARRSSAHIADGPLEDIGPWGVIEACKELCSEWLD